jgi:hypothetical protein
MKNLLDTSELSKVGLNIFLSIRVSEIPETIFKFNDDQKNKTLCLIGGGGKSLWGNLPQPLDESRHPIDEFSIFHMQKFAKNSLNEDLIEILFPNENYIIPLQQISRLLNFSSGTPMGIDICQEFGVWFAFRGIFLTNEFITVSKALAFSSPCKECNDQPCLTGREFCPVKKDHEYTASQKKYHASQILLIH